MTENILIHTTAHTHTHYVIHMSVYEQREAKKNHSYTQAINQVLIGHSSHTLSDTFTDTYKVYSASILS